MARRGEVTREEGRRGDAAREEGRRGDAATEEGETRRRKRGRRGGAVTEEGETRRRGEVAEDDPQDANGLTPWCFTLQATRKSIWL
jgi:hypothetical protein